MGLFSNIFNGTRNLIVNVGTKLFWPGEVNGVTGDPAKIGTVFTCCRVLSDNLARMPLSVFLETDNGTKEMARHRLTYLLKFRPNNYQNAQQFWSTIEYHRNQHGNGFARVFKNSDTGYPESLEIIHPGLVVGYTFVKNELFYEISNPATNQNEVVSAWDLLHFRGLSDDGIFGLSPLVAVERQRNINERATTTIDSFYKNNATTPMAITTEVPGNLTPTGAKAMADSKTQFQEQNAGPKNAGKWIHLPLGTKLQSIAMQFADAKLIETLRFTREDIAAVYGLPLFMVDGSAEKLDVEQLTTLFKNNTMGPVTALYMAEINGKLLTRDELAAGFSVMFDVMALIGMDYATLVSGIKEQVVNGLMTPNEGAKKLRNNPIAGEYGNKHFMQAQYIPLESYGQYNPLLTNDPTLKNTNTKTTKNKSNDSKK